jgi:AraC-like DNA-binding protein
MSSYRELAPSRDLHSAVLCRWVRQVPDTANSASTLILPDGCIDLIWRDGELAVAGLDRTARPNRLKPGQTILGLRLRPGVAGAVLGMPASEVVDHPRVLLEDLLGSGAAELEERLGEADGEERAYGLLERLVASRLEGAELDPLVLAACRRLGFDGSRVDRLAEALGISDRQLRRRFHAAVGYGPKMLDRVLRFRRFVSRASSASAGEFDLARLAADLGYADQSHMTRDCLRLSGMTPARLAKRWPG